MELSVSLLLVLIVTGSSVESPVLEAEVLKDLDATIVAVDDLSGADTPVMNQHSDNRDYYSLVETLSSKTKLFQHNQEHYNAVVSNMSQHHI